MQETEKNKKEGLIMRVTPRIFWSFCIIMLFIATVGSFFFYGGSIPKVLNDRAAAHFENVAVELSTPLVYKLSEEEVFYTLKNKTGILFFTWEECPWCKELIPYLVNLSMEKEVPLFIFEGYDMRDIKELDDKGNVITKKEGSSLYNTLLRELNQYLPYYEGLGEYKEKRIYLPTTIFLKDGQIIDVHTGLVDSYENPKESLTKEQENELIAYLKEQIKEIKTKSCPETGC